MGSKQANENNNNKKNKESKADSTGMAKEGTRSISLCEVEEKGYKEAKEKHTKRKIWREMVISIPWNSEKRSEQQEQCE